MEIISWQPFCESFPAGLVQKDSSNHVNCRSICGIIYRYFISFLQISYARCMVKQVILSALSWVVSTSLVIMALLHLGGDFPDIHSYVQPRLGAALLVFLIVSFGLFTVMNRKYLKALLPWAVILPLLWMGSFT